MRRVGICLAVMVTLALGCAVPDKLVVEEPLPTPCSEFSNYSDAMDAGNYRCHSYRKFPPPPPSPTATPGEPESSDPVLWLRAVDDTITRTYPPDTEETIDGQSLWLDAAIELNQVELQIRVGGISRRLWDVTVFPSEGFVRVSVPSTYGQDENLPDITADSEVSIILKDGRLYDDPARLLLCSVSDTGVSHQLTFACGWAS